MVASCLQRNLPRNLLLVSLALASGCAPDDVAPNGENSNTDEVVRGESTFEHPEVGLFEIRHRSSVGTCTATLVAPNVAITASHCVGYGSADSPGNYGTFIVRPAGGGELRYGVERYRGFATRLGPDDVALLRLAQSVPDTIARPAPLATRIPDAGTFLAVYGYGCTYRGGRLDGAKRRARFAQGEQTNRLCPGDSGGPVLVESSGAVLRINSGYYGDSFGTDLFGDVPRNVERLSALVREWSGHDPGTEGGGTGSACGSLVGATRWACVSNGRARCPDGVTLEREACANGCNAVAGGDAQCAPAPPPDSCGIYAPFPDYTCRRGGTGFARCVPGRTPEFLVCPTGYTCTPGSQWLRCYR